MTILTRCHAWLELNMADDDGISPTLPTFDLRPRVSRDQTGARASSPSSSCSRTSSSSSDSMPIILQMTPGETTTQGGDRGEFLLHQSLDCSSSKDLRGVCRPAPRYRSRPASLAATLRPRRASTGGGFSDWISMYDPQTPTAIVDLERMASGFPLIPCGVDEEVEEDGLSVETGCLAGCKGLDHDRLDSITSWQRNCCESHVIFV